MGGPSLNLVAGMKCTGGSTIGEVMNDIQKCKDICLEDSSCTGVNVVVGDGICVLRSGCTQSADSRFEFYERVQMGVLPALPPVQPPAPEWPPVQPPAPEWVPVVPISPVTGDVSGSVSVSAGGYTILANTRCAGDDASKVGETQQDLAKCKEICEQSFECFGINNIVERGICNVRTKACNLTPGDSSVEFLQKN